MLSNAAAVHPDLPHRGGALDPVGGRRRVAVGRAGQCVGARACGGRPQADHRRRQSSLPGLGDRSRRPGTDRQALRRRRLSSLVERSWQARQCRDRARAGVAACRRPRTRSRRLSRQSAGLSPHRSARCTASRNRTVGPVRCKSVARRNPFSCRPALWAGRAGGGGPQPHGRQDPSRPADHAGTPFRRGGCPRGSRRARAAVQPLRAVETPAGAISHPGRRRPRQPAAATARQTPEAGRRLCRHGAAATAVDPARG